MSTEGWADRWIFPLPWPPLADGAADVALRPWGAGKGDAAALAAAWADPDVARWTAVPADTSLAEARRWIRGEEQRRAEGLAMDVVITTTSAPGEVIGEVGFAMIDAERRWAEVGYWMGPETRGQGRSAAAVALFTDWVLRELPVRRLVARTHPDNPAAGRIAARAGFTLAGSIDGGTEVWVRDRAR